MDKEKRRAKETKGWRFGDATDFLSLTEEERQLVELRLAVSRAIRQRREQQHLTQRQVAAKLKSSQSRVAKIEAGLPDENTGRTSRMGRWKPRDELARENQ